MSDAEIQAVKFIAKRYENPQGASIEAMREIQRSRGWISDEALCDIARVLELSPDELDGVATFYNLIFRRPVGRSVILLCDSVSCWVMGCEALRKKLESGLGVKLGETTPDGRFTLLPTVCLGACDHAPAMMVGDNLFGDLDPERLDVILDWYE
ncbi:MAG TPA: NADH-quinone oxidoreductase subunit NuoE [Steroidobacteraceae bacterium]|nr:NADH-quinone oxidoreductase subunit NuoE [Steroidobacteraceae bacterium]